MNKYIIILLFSFFFLESKSQVKLPSLELTIMGGYADYEGEYNFDGYYLKPKYNSITAAIGGNINLNQYFAIGFFYNRSINGELDYPEYENGFFAYTGPEPYPVKHLIYGIRFRASLNRIVRFRPFIQFSYYYREMVAEKPSMTIAHSNNGFSPSLGLMIKMNDRLYITIPQISILFSDEQPIFIEYTYDDLGSEQFLQLEAGISYYIHNKR